MATGFLQGLTRSRSFMKQVYHFGVPIIRINVLGVLYWGPPVYASQNNHDTSRGPRDVRGTMPSLSELQRDFLGNSHICTSCHFLRYISEISLKSQATAQAYIPLCESLGILQVLQLPSLHPKMHSLLLPKAPGLLLEAHLQKEARYSEAFKCSLLEWN